MSSCEEIFGRLLMLRRGKSLTVMSIALAVPCLRNRREREDRPVMKESDVRIDDCGGIIAGKNQKEER